MLRAVAQPRLRLCCIPYAGGSAVAVFLPRPPAPRVPPPEDLLDQARAWTAGMPARPVHLFATLALHPQVAESLGVLADMLPRKGSIPPRLREIIILRMGWLCRSVYEFGQHTLFARDAGMTREEIYRITRPVSEGRWSEPEALVLRLVDELYLDDCASDETWAKLAQYFSHHDQHHDLIELVSVALCYRMISSLINTCGVQPEPGLPGWPTPL